MEKTNLTTDEKLDVVNQRLQHIQRSSDIQTALMILGFLGILSIGALVDVVRKEILK